MNVAEGDLLAAIPTAMAFVAALPYALLSGSAKRSGTLTALFVTTLAVFVAAFVVVPFSVHGAYWTTVAAMVAALVVLGLSLLAEHRTAQVTEQDASEG